MSFSFSIRFLSFPMHVLYNFHGFDACKTFAAEELGSLSLNGQAYMKVILWLEEDALGLSRHLKLALET